MRSSPTKHVLLALTFLVCSALVARWARGLAFRPATAAEMTQWQAIYATADSAWNRRDVSVFRHYCAPDFLDVRLNGSQANFAGYLALVEHHKGEKYASTVRDVRVYRDHVEVLNIGDVDTNGHHSVWQMVDKWRMSPSGWQLFESRDIDWPS